jgi:trk system potassium uptake protein TrkA
MWPQDVIECYNAEILKRDMASSMAGSVGDGPVTRAIPGARGVSMAEIPVPPSFFGHTLASVNIRKRFGVTVLLIKRRSGGDEQIADQLPDAEYVFHEGDVMLVMGSEEHLQRLDRSG